MESRARALRLLSSERACAIAQGRPALPRAAGLLARLRCMVGRCFMFAMRDVLYVGTLLREVGSTSSRQAQVLSPEGLYGG